MVTVEFQSLPGKNLTAQPYSFEPTCDEGESDPMRVRHLIEKLVRECVRDFNLRESNDRIALLTTEKIAEGLVSGKIGSPREESQTVDLDAAVAQALQAFEDKLYLLFVDSGEKRSLDEIVQLQPDTTILVIRLTALAGG